MTGKTHMAIGIAAGLTIAYGKPLNEQIIMVAASSLGSLIPDLDHPKSGLNQRLLLFKNEFFRILVFMSISASFFYLYLNTQNTMFILLSLIFSFIGISSHRGFTHSIIGVLIFSYIIKYITDYYSLNYVYKSIGMGYLLHLVADFLTPKGIKLFYPLNITVASPIVINPNSGIDGIIFALANIYSMILLAKYIL